jgi:hypothetical protein
MYHSCFTRTVPMSTKAACPFNVCVKYLLSIYSGTQSDHQTTLTSPRCVLITFHSSRLVRRTSQSGVNIATFENLFFYNCATQRKCHLFHMKINCISSTLI